MWKHSKLFNCEWLFMQIIAVSIRLNEAALCTDCSNTLLERGSKNITYGPSDKYNCWCDSTIPTSMDTDHETAVVLLLQNVSLPMTNGTGSTDCSGEIRFPSTYGYKCEFSSNYCLAFATESTICNINKIREKIPVANPTCDSIIPWNEAGGSPYKIQYYAGKLAGYTKYFTIQYLVINCKSLTTTTPALSTASEQESTTTKETSHTKYTSSLVKQYSDTTTESTSTSDNIQCPSECNSTETSLIIAIPVSGIMGLIIGVFLMFIILRYCNNNNNKKKPKNKDSMEMGSIQHQQPTVHERTAYENYTLQTTDESGYEVPIPVDNKNEQSGYEVPIQVDNKNEQQYEVMRSGAEYQYEN
uniref:uncharacterized protein LOC120347068 isoform X1 n=1 Tax=Styela clava TaxID=7725 RepID=UPI00193A83AF|nr:uncharacterized protein LOC120347068 isoform X1 [Styela clava]